MLGLLGQFFRAQLGLALLSLSENTDIFEELICFSGKNEYIDEVVPHKSIWYINDHPAAISSRFKSNVLAQQILSSDGVFFI